jgi:hypothetical protein
MTRITRHSLVLLVVFLTNAQAQTPSPQSAPQASSASEPFADFEFLPPPAQYAGPVFRLSQQYPSELPPKERIPEFYKIDFKTNWREYLLAARKYCFEGNVTPGGDVEKDWRAADQNPPRWFNMPWQTYGPRGREGVHGLTQEAPVEVKQLASTQTYTGGQTFAIGFFNEFAGHTIGQVWKDHNNPDLGKALFPEGAVLCKILFVDVPTDQVPCLINPIQWNAYVPPLYTSPSGTPRVFKKLALIQMDLMAKDSRAPHGWVFGNFQYNGATKHQNPWENLVPLGVMWGNDPDIAVNQSNPQPVDTIRNLNLKETIINGDANELPPTHLGWNGRLNGPVDNPMSSCMSCHSTAEYPALTALNPLFMPTPPPHFVPGTPEWMRWFRNLKCGVAFDADQPDPPQSTDFSLQLADSVQNFQAWQSEGRALSASAYGHAGLAVTPRQADFSRYKVRINGREQFKILRGVNDPSKAE